MDSLPDLIKENAEPLPKIEDPEFAAKFDKFANADIILIGDGSHGTSEFYRARAAITQRLIEKHGFRIVAAEADWPESRQIDRYVCGQRLREGQHPLDGFTRFPRWMWRNEEVANFVEWLKKRNANVDEEAQAHFYGLDLYSMASSIRAVIDYLDSVDPETAKIARERYACLRPWVEDPSRYGRASLTAGYALCEKKVVEMLVDLLRKRADLAKEDGDSFFDAEMNARVVAGAEQYYREMYYGRDQSWNLRDTHMFETLDRLIEVTGGAKAVVWAHNSHVGDARATSMGQARGELNIGQLCRENYGEDAVCIIGCSTHTGTVAAADNWDEPMRVMQVRPSLRESYERIMYASGLPSFLLDLRQSSDENRIELRKELMRPRLERFIGVIYRPDTERWSHYSQAILPKQMDAFVWFQETKAVKPFEIKQPKGEAPAVEETFPFGL